MPKTKHTSEADKGLTEHRKAYKGKTRQFYHVEFARYYRNVPARYEVVDSN